MYIYVGARMYVYYILYYITMCSTRSVRIFVAHYECSFYHFYYYYFVFSLINEGSVFACILGETKTTTKKSSEGVCEEIRKKIF